jgi:enamine deaminase RidA (YjgF/YER057c/UK114 family)
VSDDLSAQTRQALANLAAGLEAAGAEPKDIVRPRTYGVDHTPDKLGPVLGEVGAFFAGAAPPPNTFIGVQSLALPGVLVEIEATAELG